MVVKSAPFIGPCTTKESILSHLSPKTCFNSPHLLTLASKKWTCPYIFCEQANTRGSNKSIIFFCIIKLFVLLLMILLYLQVQYPLETRYLNASCILFSLLQMTYIVIAHSLLLANIYKKQQHSKFLVIFFNFIISFLRFS